MSNTPVTALVTGASTGLGAVYADRLARRGYDLILVARDAGRMEALAARLHDETGRRIDILPADLTNRGDLARVEARLANDASITMLVNNAGMSLNGGLLDSALDQIERLIALNVTAPTLLAAAAGKAFARRKAGAIVTIASVLALAPEMFDGVYSGSKAFVLNLSISLARQLEPLGVRVQAVLPGATRTEIWERSGKDVDSFPVDWVMEAGDLVDASLLGFDRGETITIPPLADEGQWLAFESARLAMDGRLSNREVAPRYREAVAA
ncbi:MAG: AraC family transcriptional regulator [Sphingomonas bacterium]|uniref:SDR family NAD(P)-dependent oxidoreductase n=1 Tax=Sphingomonas bacterium TaxID=1895847 RepID=UPI00262AF98A|nr:SDR family oxidoreductase [Sphingomonas bacterium]MDB5703496.1 AraC family transcriptional regulator [Sphingomonas bacterium]